MTAIESGRVEALLLSRAKLLSFLERRLNSREDAEDLLQTALLKVVSRSASLRSEEKLVPWFYRMLRNLIVDHYRQTAASERVKVAVQTDPALEMDEELFQATCACLHDVNAALKPEYAELIRRVELGGKPLHQVARHLGITSNNASVRLHRARQALREALQATCGACAEHHCLDCNCRKTSGGPHAG
ncbi:MAG TPA: sigma-70 family RNA polymerase sigma factor [Methylomirabilota bacterium]|nr:sigma-70 family RNA polymerase sigma factor [Methylomirabilota bacterium]